jgi:hypothetical protein
MNKQLCPCRFCGYEPPIINKIVDLMRHSIGINAIYFMECPKCSHNVMVHLSDFEGEFQVREENIYDKLQNKWQARNELNNHFRK